MLRRFTFMSAFISFSLCVTIFLTTLPVTQRPLPTPDEPVTARGLVETLTRPQHFAEASPNAAPVDSLTADDVSMAVSQWNEAYPALERFWRLSFAQAGRQYATPRITAVTGPVVVSACGTTRRAGPFYCSADHTIYFDVYFVAGEMKRVGERLGTDGDMAAITIMAHEWGHAMQRLLGGGAPSRRNEMQADCLSGGFARYGRDMGYLEAGDIEEAQMALAMAGGLHGSHPNPQQRVNGFMHGYENGIGACWNI